MLRARNFMAGNTMMRQLAFAKLDLFIHRFWPRRNLLPSKIPFSKLLKDTYRNAKPLHGQLPSDLAIYSAVLSVAAAYYSYKWAEVLDADAFTRFQKEGIMNGQTGIDFREKILSKRKFGRSRSIVPRFHGSGSEVNRCWCAAD